jgi:hypothetical protein
MGRATTIGRLDPELREELGRRRERGATLDELVAFLRARGVAIGRTAVWRYSQRLDAAQPIALGTLLLSIARSLRRIERLLRANTSGRERGGTNTSPVK